MCHLSSKYIVLVVVLYYSIGTLSILTFYLLTSIFFLFLINFIFFIVYSLAFKVLLKSNYWAFAHFIHLIKLLLLLVVLYSIVQSILDKIQSIFYNIEVLIPVFNLKLWQNYLLMDSYLILRNQRSIGLLSLGTVHRWVIFDMSIVIYIYN